MYIPSAVPVDSGIGGTVQLWMGDIEPWMDDERIYQIWAHVGESVTVKMIRDRLTGGPASYCFLEFQTQADAERILATYNGKPMPLALDRPFRLNWASGVAAGYGSPFMPLGAAPDSGFLLQQGRTYHPGADGAAFDNSVMSTVASAPPPAATHTVAATPAQHTGIDGPEYSLFVGDLASEVTDVQLVHEFRCRYPSVRAAKVVTDPITLLPRGYGFVRFSDEADQQRALVEMQGYMIGSRAIRVSTATPKRSSSILSTTHQHSHSLQHIAPSREAAGSPTSSVSTSDSSDMYNPATDPFNTTVFVGGLTHPVSEDELYAFFTVYGEVTYCKIPPNRGCGFVTFAKRANAESAIRTLNGHMLGGSRVRLSWGRSQSHARHNHRHHRYHNQSHRNSSGGGSSGVTTHRNSVSEHHTLVNRRSVSIGKGAALNAVHGLGLSGASIAGIAPSTLASAPVVNPTGTYQSDVSDARLAVAAAPGMTATHLAHSQTPVPGHANDNSLGGMQVAQQQQQQPQQPQNFMNGYSMAPHSSLYMTSPANPQGGAAFNMDTLGMEHSTTGTPFPYPFSGYPQQMYGYSQSQHQNPQQQQQQQPLEQAMLATHATAHAPGGLGDSPLLPTHFARQHQQPQQGPALRNSGHFDNFYPMQQNQQQQEYRDPAAFGSGTVLPGLAACPGDMLTRRLSALSLGNAAARSRPSSLVEGQPPMLGVAATFSFGTSGGIGGGLTPTGGLMAPQNQQQQQQQQAHPPLLDRRPSAGVIGQRRLSSKPSFQYQLQPQRSSSQLSMTQLWQPASAANSAAIKGAIADLGGLELSSTSQPAADYTGSLHTPALSMRLSSSSLSLLALSPSMGGEAASGNAIDGAYFGERSSGEIARKLPTVPQKRQ
ncbi:hypothetical protein LPJ59_001471 [Coemansia sp. RSA 2399]|nr:hypothetical protein LPJ59_001471 [Coemansia sp. RSA 2399]